MVIPDRGGGWTGRDRAKFVGETNKFGQWNAKYLSKTIMYKRLKRYLMRDFITEDAIFKYLTEQIDDLIPLVSFAHQASGLPF
ncbi:hypothetical protein G6M17_19555 [Agrobacterium tumefaciens]|nr:hypothetical protein [Agrobacterium tumefaciens]